MLIFFVLATTRTRVSVTRPFNDGLVLRYDIILRFFYGGGGAIYIFVTLTWTGLSRPYPPFCNSILFLSVYESYIGSIQSCMTLVVILMQLM